MTKPELDLLGRLEETIQQKFSRLYNLIAELAHPRGDCKQNDFEDEAHDLIRELRAALIALARTVEAKQEIPGLRDLIAYGSEESTAALKRKDRQLYDFWQGWVSALQRLTVPDAVCEHGTALDVHCCGCHSGFLFDIQSCTCLNPVPSTPGSPKAEP